MASSTHPDPWIGSVHLRNNFCPTHLAAEFTEDGGCLGCAIEREREILTPEWKFKVLPVFPVEPSPDDLEAKPSTIARMTRTDRNYYRSKPISELAARCVINEEHLSGTWKRYRR